MFQVNPIDVMIALAFFVALALFLLFDDNEVKQ